MTLRHSRSESIRLPVEAAPQPGYSAPARQAAQANLDADFANESEDLVEEQLDESK